MAALLVGLFVMGVMATVAMPVWPQAARREKEAELVFRGEQYARAVGLFQRKMGPGTLPPNLDLLVDQKFLRRKFTDPITGKGFAPINAATAQAAGLGNTPGGRGAAGTVPGGGPGGAGPGGSGIGAGAGGAQGGLQGGGLGTAAGGARQSGAQEQGAGGPGTVGQSGLPQGGIVGVVSSSDAASLRLYNGRDHYNQWAFVYNPPTAVVGGAAGGVQGGEAGGVGQGGARQPAGGPARGVSQPGRAPGSAPQQPVGPQGSGANPPIPLGMPRGGGPSGGQGSSPFGPSGRR